jgi:hypothetical protein
VVRWDQPGGRQRDHQREASSRWSNPSLLEGDDRGEKQVVLLVDVQMRVGFQLGQSVIEL